VCVVNWNCKAELRRCLASLTSRRQGLRLEVIVVDNASTDGAADMVEREFPRARLIRNVDNVGFARGCNQAAAVARGRYLFFLNNDTVVPRDALARLVAFARANPEVGLVGPRLRDAAGRVQCSARQRPTVAALLHRLTLLRWTGLFRAAYRRYRGRGMDATTARPVEVLMGAALLMPRRIYRAVGGWDERYTFGGEDIDLCARVARTHEVVYYPAVEVLHLGRTSSRKHTGYATANTLVGVARCLRQTGTAPAALAAYKLAFTLDLPLRAAALGARYLVSRLRGKERAVGRARQELLGMAYFVRHALWAFWRA
jgi:GT2 family glycosyltransferase